MNDGNGYKSLVFAVRLSALGFLASRLALILAVLCLPSVLVALIFSEYHYIPWFFAVIGLLGAFAGLCWRLPEPRRVIPGEGLVLTAAVFLITPLLMTLALRPAQLPFMDLLLETVSAITTTGLSTVAQPELAEKTLLFTRAWMQWYGGLGIIVLSVTLLMQRSLAVFQLLELPESQGFVSAATIYARRVFVIYILLTVVAIVISGFALKDLFNGMLLGFAAVSTGGFSSFSDSLGTLPFVSQLILVLCGMAGAISFAIYLQIGRKAWRQVVSNQELHWFVALALLLCALLACVSWMGGVDLGTAIQQALVMGFSAISTTGFSNMNAGDMSDAYFLLLIAGMFLGGCLGSTAGGFKIFRVLVVWQVFITYFRRASATPHAIIEPRIQGRPLTQDQVQLAMLTGSLLVALILVGWFVFLVYGYPAIPSLFEVVSAVATVGLSSNLTGSDLPGVAKAVLIVAMIAGRVEVLALLYMLYPSAWIGRRNQQI